MNGCAFSAPSSDSKESDSAFLTFSCSSPYSSFFKIGYLENINSSMDDGEGGEKEALEGSQRNWHFDQVLKGQLVWIVLFCLSKSQLDFDCC